MYELTEIVMDLLELCIELEERYLLCSEGCCPTLESLSEKSSNVGSHVSMEELIQDVLEGKSSWN